MIVIVEADDAERQLLLNLCAQIGCEAVGVGEGRAALDFLQMTTDHVAVILLDLWVALADETICTRLHSSHVQGAIPIVIMSEGPSTPAQAARLGIGAFLPKPVAADAIEAIVQCYAPWPRSRERGGIHHGPGGGRQ